MKCNALLSVVCACAWLVSSAPAGTVFVAELNGAKERPVPIVTPATGVATAELDGGPGAWVLTYELTYENLTPGNPDFLAAHIHDTLEPPGAPPTEQFGPILHPLDGLTSPITGDWRFDDSPFALTDEAADKLLAGELYFNVHSEANPAGEIRGQIIVIPLPASLGMGLAGFATIGGIYLLRLLRRRRAAH